MGYFGLPSKACAPCRSRRIKCDLSRPSCGQCARSYRTCSGYRDQTDLLFRDQTENVACKAKRAKKLPQPKSVTCTKPVPSKARPTPKPQIIFSDDLDIADPTALYLPLSVEHQAFCFFFSNYIAQPSKKFVTIYDSIPPLYCSSSYDSPLSCIITALGMAGLSHHTDATGLEVTAGMWYNKALHKMNRTLQDPLLAKEDLTLLVVILLGLYETNTCRTPRSMKSWIRHIRGATALLELRGENQVDSDFGRTLFVQTRTQVIAGCIQTRAPMPEVVVRLSQKCRTLYPNPLEDVVPMSFAFCDLRSKYRFVPENDQSEAHTRDLVAQYSAVSQELTEWRQGLPPSYHPRTMYVEKPSEEVLRDYYYIYDDVWTAGVVNNCSANAILVNESLIVQFIHLRDTFTYDPNELIDLNARISAARKELISLIDEICASVPYLLDTNLAVTGVGLLWALYVSAQMSPRAAPVHEKTRGWITGRLEKIGREMGVRQATTLAGFLHQKIEVTQLIKDGFDAKKEYYAEEGGVED